MQRIQSLLFALALAALIIACAPDQAAQPEKSEPVKSEPAKKNPPADCPVTTTGILSFEAPAPYSPIAPWPGLFWFGSESLWTSLHTDGVWAGLPLNPQGYTQKIMWWSSFYSLPDEPEPALVVTGRRLDAEAPPLKTYGATNASAADIGEAMLTGVDFPTLGCWEVRGEYKKTSLNFYVWLAP